MKNPFWQVYIIEASDGSLYTGITTDMERRWQAHVSGKGGARFFRGRKPVKLVYTEKTENRSEASKREAAIKKLRRKEKLLLIESLKKSRLTCDNCSFENSPEPSK